MTDASRIAALAAVTVPCVGGCEGTGDMPMTLCQTCKGRGRVPLFPALRRDCWCECHGPGNPNDGTMLSVSRHVGCCGRDCCGWTPVTDDAAVAWALLTALVERGYACITSWCEHTGDYVVTLYEILHDDDHYGGVEHGPTPFDALIAAAEAVVAALVADGKAEQP